MEIEIVFCSHFWCKSILFCINLHNKSNANSHKMITWTDFLLGPERDYIEKLYKYNIFIIFIPNAALNSEH